MDVDLDKEFLQDLKELKMLVADKDLLDLHKRCPWGVLGPGREWGLRHLWAYPVSLQPGVYCTSGKAWCLL